MHVNFYLHVSTFKLLSSLYSVLAVAVALHFTFYTFSANLFVTTAHCTTIKAARMYMYCCW